MENLKLIQTAYENSESYPHLAVNLKNMGIESYSVEVSSGTTIYRFANGINSVHTLFEKPLKMGKNFNEKKLKKALQKTQSGKTAYPEFLEEIAAAGVRIYEATFNSEKSSVAYYGIGGFYQEEIPSTK